VNKRNFFKTNEHTTMSDAAKTTTPDQGDVLAQLEAANAEIATLKGDKATLETQLKDANGKVESHAATITTLTGERDNAKAEVVKVTGERQTLQGKVTALEGENTTLKTERDDWKAKAEPVQKQLAAAMVKHGIRNVAKEGAATASAQPGKKLSADEKVAAAKAKQSATK
jgi:chromosome segregation ATPase